jgi:hypothetical protein
LTSGKNSLTANGSFVSASPELDVAPASTISPHPEEKIHGEGRIASSNQAISVALQDRTSSQQASEETQASPLRSDGGSQGELFQRSFSPVASRGFATIPPPESRIKAQADCAPLRPTRSRPRIGKDYSKQARKHKLLCLGAMADFKECFSNGHLRHLLCWKSRRGFWRARSKALKVCAPVATLLWPSVGVKPTLGKSEDLESSGTLECSELDNKAQNTSHWGVLSVIKKVLKRRYRKWPRIDHLDIRRPSYGRKKGGESNWQFDSRPLKVGNRPLPDLRIESAICVGKISTRATSLVQTSSRSDLAVGSYELPKSRDSIRDSFGTISGFQLGSPGKKSHLDVVSAEWRREYYMGEGAGFPRVRAVVCLVVRSACGLSQHPRVSRNVN